MPDAEFVFPGEMLEDVREGASAVQESMARLKEAAARGNLTEMMEIAYAESQALEQFGDDIHNFKSTVDARRRVADWGKRGGFVPEREG